MVEVIKLGKNEHEITIFEKTSGKLNKTIVRELIFLDAHRTCCTKEIENFELELKIKLPREYRSFLLNHNGGVPKPNCFNDSVVDYFFSIVNLKGIYSIQSYLNTYDKRYPTVFLPIASAGGDLILLGLCAEYDSKIYYWDHDLEAQQSADKYFDNISLIANNFSEFLDLFYDLDAMDK